MQKSSRATQKVSRPVIAIVIGGGIAFLFSFLVLLGAAAALSAGKLPESLSAAVAVGAVAVGSCLGGIAATVRSGSRSPLAGVLAGVICGLVWLLSGLLSGGELSLIGTLRTLAASVGGGLVGGLLVPKPKKRRK